MADLLASTGDPARVALRDGARAIRYGELPGLVAAEAAWLASAGPGLAHRYALLADNGTGWALTDLALASRDLLHVPLPGYFTRGQLAHVVANAGIDRLVTDQPGAVAGLGAGFTLLGESPQTGFGLWARETGHAGPPAAVPAGTVKVTYTSGSTAEPRGVCLSAALLGSVARSLADATAALALDRHLCLLPLATLLENVAGIHAPLLAGATCEIPSLAETGMSYGGLDARRLVATISARQPASLILVPELLRVLVHAARAGWTPPVSLRFIAVGGATVAPGLLAEAARLGLPVFEGYGLSECGSVVCLNTPGRNRPGTVGQPLPHARVRVAADGEIHVANAGMLGYLGDPPRDPAAELATGDLGAIDGDGFVHVLGRRKNLLITSLGRNITPEWVERELQLEPEIALAMVVGDARPFLGALVLPTTAGEAPGRLAAAVARANRRLPDYARVRAWARPDEPFTHANGMLTANGRLRREHILRQHAALVDSLFLEAATTGETSA